MAKIDQSVLNEFIGTINDGSQYSRDELHEMFPEFGGSEELLNSAMRYADVYNNDYTQGKINSTAELNAMFPEFFSSTPSTPTTAENMQEATAVAQAASELAEDTKDEGDDRPWWQKTSQYKTLKFSRDYFKNRFMIPYEYGRDVVAEAIKNRERPESFGAYYEQKRKENPINTEEDFNHEEGFGWDVLDNIHAGVVNLLRLPFKAVTTSHNAYSDNKYIRFLQENKNALVEMAGGDYMREMEKMYDKEGDRYKDNKGIIDSLLDGDFGKAAGKLTLGVARNSSNTLATIGLSYLGVPPQLTAGALACNAALDKDEELWDDETLTPQQKSLSVFGTFCAEFSFEYLADVRITKMIGKGEVNAVKRELTTGLAGAWNRFLKTPAGDAIKKTFNKVWKYSGEEVTEMMTEFAEQSIDIAIGKRDGYDWNAIGDAGLIAFGSDKPLVGAISIRDTHNRRKITGEIEMDKRLSAIAQSYGLNPGQAADLIIANSHGEEMTEADLKFVNDAVVALNEKQKMSEELSKLLKSSNLTSDELEGILIKNNIGQELSEKEKSILDKYNEITQAYYGANESEDIPVINIPAVEEPASQTPPAQPVVEQPTQPESKKAPKKPVAIGSQFTGIEIDLNGVNTIVNVIGKAMFNEDGTIDFDNSPHLYITDNEGNPFGDSKISSVQDAINAHIVNTNAEVAAAQQAAQVESAAQTAGRAQPVAEETSETQIPPVQEFVDNRTPEQIDADEAAAVEQAEQQRIDGIYNAIAEQVNQKGGKALSSLTPEQAFIWRWKKKGGSLEAAIERAKTGIAEAEKIKNIDERDYEIEQWQALIDKYAPQEQQQETQQVETPAQQPVVETPVVEAPAAPVQEEAPVEKSEESTQEYEPIDLTAKDIVIMYDIHHNKYVPCRKTEEGKTIRVDNGKEVKGNAWKEVDKRLVKVGNKSYYILMQVSDEQLEKSKGKLKHHPKKGNVVLVQPVDNSQQINVPIADVVWGDGKYEGKNAFATGEDNIEEQYKVLRRLKREAKTIDEALDYPLYFGQDKDGNPINVTLRDLIDMGYYMEERVDEDGNKYMAKSWSGKGILTKLKEHVLQRLDNNSESGDITGGILSWYNNVAEIWNGVIKRENLNERVEKNTSDFVAAARNSVLKDGKVDLTMPLLKDKDELDKLHNPLDHVRDAKRVIDRLKQSEEKNGITNTGKRKATEEDINRLTELSEKLQDENLSPDQIYELADEVRKLRSEVDFGVPEQQQEEQTEQSAQTEEPVQEEQEEPAPAEPAQPAEPAPAEPVPASTAPLGETITEEVPAPEKRRGRKKKAEVAESATEQTTEQQEEQAPMSRLQSMLEEVKDLKRRMQLGDSTITPTTISEKMDAINDFIEENGSTDELWGLVAEMQVGDEMELTEQGRRTAEREVEILREAGVEVDLISESQLPDIIGEERMRELRDSKGVVYGMSNGKKILLIQERMNPNTPVHELGHLWVASYRQSHPSEWKNAIDLLKKTEMWKTVLKDDRYSNIHGNEQEMASEVFSRLLGAYYGATDIFGNSRFEESFEKKGMIAKLTSMMRRFLRDTFGMFDYKLTLKDKGFDENVRELLSKPISEIAGLKSENLKEGKIELSAETQLTEEEQRIKSEAQERGDFMKAPNGKDSNLTEKQWLQVRTRAFMDWFGDWIKVPRLEKLRKSEPIKVEFNGEYELNRNNAKDWALKNVRGEYTNTDTGEKVLVSGSGIDEVMAHGEREDAHLKSIIAIPKMIEDAIFIEERGPEHANSKFDRYRYYVCGLKIDDIDYTAKVVIGVKDGVRYYDHMLTEIEKGRLIDSLNELPNPVADNQASKIDGKDTKLFSILQINSSKKLNYSKILDENGEPKVVYRGSKNPNSFVLHSKYQSGALWFTDSRAVAEHYARINADHELTPEELAERVQPVFLKMDDAETVDAKGRAYDNAVDIPVYIVEDESSDKNLFFQTREDAESYCKENGISTDEIYESTTSGDVADAALEGGKDGVIFKDMIDGNAADGTDVPSTIYVTKSSEQAKSATQNNGEFDGNNPDIRFQIGNAEMLTDENEPLEPAKKLSWFQKKVNAGLDQANGIRLMMKRIGEIEGKKVSMDEDVREALESKRSKIANILERFGIKQSKDLMKALRTVRKSMKKTGLWKKGMNDYYVNSEGVRSERSNLTLINVLEMYLQAKDTLERLSLGKPVRDNELTFRILQYLGMDVNTELKTQEHRNAVLQAMVNKFETTLDEKDVKAMWSAINGCTRFIIDKLHEGGLIGTNEYEELKKSQFYVPERGFAQLESDEYVREKMGYGKTKKRGITPEAMRKAEGGESMATDVLANILYLATNAVACAEENKVRQAAFSLLENHSDACRKLGYPAAERVWYVRDGLNEDGTPRYKASLTKPSADIIAQNEEVLELIRGYREDLNLFPDNKAMQEFIKQKIDEAKKYLLIVPKRDAGGAAVSRVALAGEEIPKVLVSVPTEDGDVQQYTMVFPNQPEIANALNGVLNTKFSDSWLKTVGRIFSSLFTTYNPLFWSRNLPRDVLFVLQKGTAERGVGYGAFFAAEMARPATTIAPIVAWVSGHELDSEIGREFRQFLDGGGNTGFTQMKDIEEFREEADRIVNGENAAVAGFKFLFGKVPAALNEFSELWTRFAVYRATKASLAMENRMINTFGRSAVDMKRMNEYSAKEMEAMALHDARNFSTNFNRRGAGGFIDFFNSISMFSNASIQGAMTTYRTFEQGEIQKGIRGSMSLMILPALLGYLLTLMSPDDDDKEEGMIPDYIRQNYLVFLDKRIPLSYELVPWYRIGVNYALMQQGKVSKSDGIENISMGFAEHSLPAPPSISSSLKEMIDMAVPETDFSAKNPNFWQAILPLIYGEFANPFMELSHGKNWTGNNLRYEYAKDTPQWMHQDYEAELYKSISKQIYEWSGGDMDNPSITVDGKKMNDFQNISPKEVKSIIGSVTPNGWVKIACWAWGLHKGNVREQDTPLKSDFTLSHDAEMARIGISVEMGAMIREAKENYTRIPGLQGMSEKDVKSKMKEWDMLYKDYTEMRLKGDDFTEQNVKAYKNRLERKYGIRVEGNTREDLMHAYIVVMTNEEIEAKGLKRTIDDMERWRAKYKNSPTIGVR